MATKDQCSNELCLCPNHKIAQHAPFTEDSSAINSIYHLLHSNTSPTPLEEGIILASVADLESHKTALRANSEHLYALRKSYHDQISRIDAEIESQKRTELLLQNAIRVRRRILAPVRRLPTEILRKIFLSTVDHMPERSAELDWNDLWSFKDPECVLWAIELVCQRWRAVVVDYPKVWSYLSFKILPSDDFDNTSRQLNRLGVQLDRARLHTLSVALYPGSALNTTSNSVPNHLVHFLLPHARRIKSLDLVLPHRHIRSLELLARRLSSLTHLAITNTSSSYESNFADPTIGEPASLFQHCAQLQTVSFTSVRSPISRFLLPWNTVRSLSTAYPYHPRALSSPGNSVYEICLLLRAAPGLQQCSFCIVTHRTPALLDMPLLALPCLQQLELIVPDPHTEALLQLLEKITLPSLTSLTICTVVADWIAYTSHDTFPIIVDAIERWKCPLQTVKYPRGDVKSSDLARLVKATATTLSFLELHDLRMSKTDKALYIRHHCSTDENLLETILHHLSMASLTAIRITGGAFSVLDWDNDSVFATLVDAVEVSQCPLEDFRYHRGMIKYEDVLRLLHATSNTLKSLALERIASRDLAIRLVDTLTAPNSSSESLVAPRLHTLVLAGWVHRSSDPDTQTFSAKAYVDMVRSRNAEAPFRKLHIGWEAVSNECPLSDAVRELELIHSEMTSAAPGVVFTYEAIEEYEAGNEDNDEGEEDEDDSEDEEDEDNGDEDEDEDDEDNNDEDDEDGDEDEDNEDEENEGDEVDEDNEYEDEY
ncbi:hypothetical protein CYLTODRAFT_445499 [Cylindrobasidium torrendii FP15055 ss-10]|uniref:Uncharacterized protein n=1 Tax=Cylindrobasidium torrendii FP15055 ss-10 TaxID=1314674 RepID=A0A0D7B4Y9_9AGAR|nr:hypothetical protein CYLTODRAFT_445499 [Cylindrobasidium torrendii FP15055 ss-10]